MTASLSLSFSFSLSLSLLCAFSQKSPYQCLMVIMDTNNSGHYTAKDVSKL